MDDEVQRRAVTSGEMPGLMTAYQCAVRGADRLRAGLIAASLSPDDPHLGDVPADHVLVAQDSASSTSPPASSHSAQPRSGCAS